MTTLEQSEAPKTLAREIPAPVKESARMAAAIRREITEDQICILTFDRPDSAANIFDRATLEELARDGVIGLAPHPDPLPASAASGEREGPAL